MNDVASEGANVKKISTHMCPTCKLFLQVYNVPACLAWQMLNHLELLNAT